MPLSWSRVAPDFVPDGSLRDVYVQGAELHDWDVALAYFRATYPPLAFTIDGETAPMPARAADAFAVRPGASPRLSFSAGGVNLACHFFTPEEIEMDLLPQHVDSPERLESVADLLRGLATVTGKAAVLTAENQPDAVILRADPATGKVVHEPPTDAAAI
jgi:hypothetical protein